MPLWARTSAAPCWQAACAEGMRPRCSSTRAPTGRSRCGMMGLFVSLHRGGPRLEGAGIHMGCGSVSGAVDGFPSGRMDRLMPTPSGTRPRWASGSGLIDALACLLRLGRVDETGATREDRALHHRWVTSSPGHPRRTAGQGRHRRGHPDAASDSGNRASKVKALTCRRLWQPDESRERGGHRADPL